MKEKNKGWSKHIMLRFQVGLVISLSLTLVAFEWKSEIITSVVDLTNDEPQVIETIELPPQTEQIPKKPKVVIQPKIEEVKDEEVLEEVITKFAIDIEEPQPEEQFSEEPIIEEVEEPDFFVIVEKNAEPVGGQKAFLKYLAKNMKYPRRAAQMGVEGKVYIQFIVDKDGSLTQLEVVRGIGSGCDEESLRVLKKAPKWNPGKQRGVAVRQRMIVPITFKLN